MEFKSKLSTLFILQIFVITASSVLALLDFFKPLANQGLLHYHYILYALFVFIWVLQLYRQIYAGLNDKPILAINEEYIYDFNHDVKYYWRDIESFQKKMSWIYINLHQPTDYLDKIGNPFRRFMTKLWFKPAEKRSSFFIDTNAVAVDGDDLLVLLDGYLGKGTVENP